MKDDNGAPGHAVVVSLCACARGTTKARAGAPFCPCGALAPYGGEDFPSPPRETARKGRQGAQDAARDEHLTPRHAPTLRTRERKRIFGLARIHQRQEHRRGWAGQPKNAQPRAPNGTQAQQRPTTAEDGGARGMSDTTITAAKPPTYNAT